MPTEIIGGRYTTYTSVYPMTTALPWGKTQRDAAVGPKVISGGHSRVGSWGGGLLPIPTSYRDQ